MELDGIHHVTCITADAPRNVDFYTRVLGLRMVKKTVNQDDPTVYHLFYADEAGTPGSDITFFEYPGVRQGRAGVGMVHTVQWRVGSDAALDFWEGRLAGEAQAVAREQDGVTFGDPEGLRHRLAISTADDAPLVAEHPEVPAEHALQGFDAVRAYAAAPDPSRDMLEDTLGFEPAGDRTWEARGPARGGRYAYDEPPAERGLGGAGTVHHVAWATQMEDHEEWHRRVSAAGTHPSSIIDRFWFRSIYFREPSGVLFELATLGPGFSLDEDPEHLGETLILPPAFEHLRGQVEPILTPIPDPRPWAKTG
ncbi:MAG: Glyoxalase/bleomycin resistance protein/dioxygenase [Gaiellaceae bacterium]|jgi:glyoxalase family protein|nr:Glyoxalase/bleomycin resistance protein/dioxygenase [Gaiellaceae bacterium]